MVQRSNNIRRRSGASLLLARAVACAVCLASGALLGSCTVAGSPVRIGDPLTSPAAVEEIAVLDDAPVQAAVEEPIDPHAVADGARTALDAASATDEANLFDAVTGIDRTLDASDVPEVEAAVAAFRDAGCSVGFVVYDLFSQKGMGCNADGRYFSASTVKAPYVAFAVQDAIDGGRAAFDEEVVEDVILDGTGVMASDDTDRYDLRTVLANTIVHSDNTGYALARERFGEDDFNAWCAAANVDASVWEGDWYPSYTPRDLAKLWLNIGAYIAEGEGEADWLAEVLGQTDRSFLREALGDRRRVLSKPGYEIDMPGLDVGALNDAGLVLADSGPYVVAIMSDADYDDEFFTDNEPLLVDLAVALDAAHDRLLVGEGAA